MGFRVEGAVRSAEEVIGGLITSQMEGPVMLEPPKP